MCLCRLLSRDGDDLWANVGGDDARPVSRLFGPTRDRQRNIGRARGDVQQRELTLASEPRYFLDLIRDATYSECRPAEQPVDAPDVGQVAAQRGVVHRLGVEPLTDRGVTHTKIHASPPRYHHP